MTPVAFGRLLAWLDGGIDSRGQAYVEIRRRLVFYFDRRNRPSPEDLADDTLNRVARTLEENGSIEVTPPARYCYVIARFVLLEDLRRREHGFARLDDPRAGDIQPGADQTSREPDEAAVTREHRFACLEACLDQLKPEQRSLILEYYRDTGREKIERRRELARRLGLSMNALAIRACRIRDTLEACVAGGCQKP